MPAGRPSKFEEIDLDLVERLCKLGLSDEELAQALDIATSTLYEWKNTFPEFSESIKRGKIVADANIAEKLYHRALGYEHEDVHISNYQGEITITPIVKHYAPDPTAAIFWLKNRQPKLWRDKKEIEGNFNVKTTKDLTDDELATIAANQ